MLSNIFLSLSITCLYSFTRKGSVNSERNTSGVQFFRLKKVFFTFPAILILLVHSSLFAQTPKEIAEIVRVVDSIEQSFKWQTGRVALSGDVAYVDVPQGMRFLILK